MAKGWAVAAGSRLAAESAAEALRAGGTAADAAVAAAFAAFVAEPVLASPFGGGFAMLREADGRMALLDFFAQTPRRARPEAELDLRQIEADFGDVRQRFWIGAATVATPGAAAGLKALHAAGGRIPLPELAASAVEAAAKGAPLDALQAHVAAVVAPILAASAESRAIWADAEGRPLGEGDRLANATLADFLDALAREDARFVSHGEPAAALAELCGPGGHLTRDDLRAYAPRWRAPEIVGRLGARIALNPAQAAGGALIGFALALSPRDARPVEIARALEATDGARAESGLGDDPHEAARRLAAPETLARWRGRLAAAPGRGPLVRRGTTHVSVVDAAGRAAALSLSNGEGCGLIVSGTGAMANNFLGETDLVAEPTRWPRDVRLSSMMAPTLVEWPDGRVAALGTGGSNRIRSAMTQALLHLVDGRLRLEEAVGRPRLHVETAEPHALDFEDRFPEAERSALLETWPEARAWAADSLFFGGVHAVRREREGAVEAAGDPRRAGVALAG